MSYLKSLHHWLLYTPLGLYMSGRLREPNGDHMLFLDRGGIRGPVEIEILIEIGRRTGHRITELFDWIIGTSIGGIIALALVYGRLT